MFIFKRPLLNSKKNAETSFKYAEKLSKIKKYDLAEIILKDILSFNHRFSLAYLARAQISWIKASEIVGEGLLDIDEEIESYLNDALHFLDYKDKELHLEILHLLYMLYAKQQKFSDAIDICKKMLKIDSNLLIVRKDLVGFYCNIGKYKYAINEYLRIKNQDPVLSENAKRIIENYAQFWDTETNEWKSYDFESLLEKYSTE